MGRTSRDVPAATTHATVVEEILDALWDSAPRSRATRCLQRIVWGVVHEGRIPLSEIRQIETMVGRAYDGWSNRKRWEVWLLTEAGFNYDVEAEDAAKRPFPASFGPVVRDEVADWVAIAASVHARSVARTLAHNR